MLKLGREQAQHECRSFFSRKSTWKGRLKLALTIFKEERGINLLHEFCAMKGLIKLGINRQAIRLFLRYASGIILGRVE